MKTLIYSNTGLSSWQIGINTEVIDLLQKEGKNLRVVNCNSRLSNCFFNSTGNPIGCALCQSRQNKLLDFAGVLKKSIYNIEPLVADMKFTFPKFNSLDDLINYHFEEFNIGRGPASSIVSYLRDYNISSNKYQDLIEIELIKSINVLKNFIIQISDFKPDEIYLFNGRFSEVWPVILLAEKYDIDYYCIEAGSPKKYEIFKNALPQSIKSRHESIIDIWDSSNPLTNIDISCNWFSKRRNKTNSEEIQFTLDQEKDQIPNKWNKNKTNIVIFNSSEDELKALQEWQIGAYKSQNEAIETIAKHYCNNSDIQFYLRVHPNLGKVNNIQIAEIQKMNYSNLKIIQPHDKIDTYKLIDIADKVITFGSSTGIEATFWGATSILFGKSLYSYLDATYEVYTYEELYALIETKKLPAKNKTKTYPFGYYIKTYGIKPVFFEGKGLRESTYRDKKIRILYISTVYYLLKYIYKIPIWLRIQKALNQPFRLSSFFKFKL